MNYYCVGVTFSKEHGGDQLSRFLKEGIWENGRDKYINTVINIPIGTKLAAKANNRNKNTLDIKAVGEVTGNNGDGRTLLVDWKRVEFSIPGKGAAYPSTIREVTKQEDIDQIFSSQQNIPANPVHITQSRYSQNIILYGPSGTGKTYETIDLSVEIIDGQNNQDHKANKVRFDLLRKEGQIDFVTFHQSYTYEDFVMGLKPDITAGSLMFEQREGIFYRMAKRAEENFRRSIQGGQKQVKSFDEM